MLKCLQNIWPYPDQEQRLQAWPVNLLVFGALESKITHTHPPKKIPRKGLLVKALQEKFTAFQKL